MSAEFTVQLPTALAQLEAYYAANWAVTDWYIDGTVGSDSNNGTTAATPLKTGRELKRRLGPSAEWNHSVTIHVLANGMIDPLVIDGLMLTTGIHVDVIGTETVIASDTIAAYQPRSQTVPRAIEITATSISDFTPYLWKRLRVTAGTRPEWTTWIAKAGPKGQPLNVARCSYGGYVSPSYTYDMLEFSNPAAGDQFVIEELPVVPYLHLNLSGPTNTTSGIANFPERQYMVKSIDCPLMHLSSITHKITARSLVFGCAIERAMIIGGANTSYTAPEVVISKFRANASTPQVIYPTVPAYGCLFGENTSAVVMLLFGIEWLTVCLFQGCYVQASTDTMLNGCQIFDCTDATAGAFNIYGADCYIYGISGDDNAIGLGVRNGSVIRYGSTYNLKGTIAARLIGTPNIDLTSVQALQPDDYAQKGEATLVAGTVTVTVPWYENTTQKVLITPNTPGGTPGNWTVTQPSNTQFTVTSSSVLDTSKVNWFITPLGRNIFISKF